MHDLIKTALARAVVREHLSLAHRARLARSSDPIPADEAGLVLRVAGPGDGPALERLAALDSRPDLAARFARPEPVEPVLVAEVDGDVHSALSLADGELAADPFRPTAALSALLRLRAQQLTGAALRPRLS